MSMYQLSFLDPVRHLQVACIRYEAEDDAGALQKARLQHFYLPAELRRSGKLIASFEQECAPTDLTKVRTSRKRGH